MTFEFIASSLLSNKQREKSKFGDLCTLEERI